MPHLLPPQCLPLSPSSRECGWGTAPRRGWSATLQRREARQLSERGRSAKVTSRASVCWGAGLGSLPENGFVSPLENCLWSPLANFPEVTDPTDLLPLLSSLSLPLSSFSRSSTSSTSSFPVPCPEVPEAVFLLMFRERRRVRSTCWEKILIWAEDWFGPTIVWMQVF